MAFLTETCWYTIIPHRVKTSSTSFQFPYFLGSIRTKNQISSQGGKNKHVSLFCYYDCVFIMTVFGVFIDLGRMNRFIKPSCRTLKGHLRRCKIRYCFWLRWEWNSCFKAK